MAYQVAVKLSTSPCIKAGQSNPVGGIESQKPAKALRSHMLKLCTPSVTHSLLLLPADQDTELLAPSLAPCLLVCHHTSCHDDNGLKL